MSSAWMFKQSSNWRVCILVSVDGDEAQMSQLLPLRIGRYGHYVGQLVLLHPMINLVSDTNVTAGRRGLNPMLFLKNEQFRSPN